MIRQYSRISFIIVFCLAFTGSPALASTYVEIEDHETYALLSYLEAVGVIQDALLSTRPLSRREVVRLTRDAKRNAAERDSFVKSQVRALEQRVRPDEFRPETLKAVDTAYVKYLLTDAEVLTLVYNNTLREKEQAFNANNNGDLYDRGSNFRAGVTGRMEEFGHFSAYLNPEVRASDETQRMTLKKAYAVIGFTWIDIFVGKDSQWWGPGYNGSILFSNNAEPLTMLKFTAPRPLQLPWVFKYLGPFQYSFFVTQLAKDRSDYPEPYFYGMRLNFKPHPYLELGLERTSILGGSGRSTSLHTWLDSLFGSNEHTTPDTGDQRAGFDMKLTLPFKLQPLQVYWARAGEDSRQKTISMPYKFEDLVGIYLPRILGFERIGLRAEYAVNHVKDWPNVWYYHGTYNAGYTNKDMVIGHHMGTDSRDLFLELGLLLPEKNARVLLSYDQKTHNLSLSVREVSDEVMLKTEILLTPRVSVTAFCGYGRIENPGNMPGPTQKVSEVEGEAQYRF